MPPRRPASAPPWQHQVEQVASFLGGIAPARAYLAVPTRPPAVRGVGPPSAQAVVEAHEIFRNHLSTVALLASPEEGAFGHGDDPTGDLLAILAVHPMPEGVAREYLEEAGTDPATLDELLAAERLARVDYRGNTFVVGRWGAVPRR